MLQYLSSNIKHLLFRLREAQERFFQTFRDRVYPETFSQEINEQCRIFFPFYAIPFSLVALPYIALDKVLLPNEPLVVVLRYGMSVVVVIAFSTRYLWQYQARHRLIAAAMMYYLILSAGIITGLAKAHPSYFGGYCYVIVLLGALPVPSSQLIMGLILSLSVFAGLSFHLEVDFTSPAVRYGLQDLMSSIVVHTCLSFGWSLARRNAYEQGRAIQEQKRLLEHQAEELIALNSEKNEMLSIVAHDLKNPITAVRGLGELIKSGYTQGVQLQEVAQQIMNTGDKMLDLVKNLLVENQLEEGKMPFALRILNIAVLVEASIREYRQIAALKSITLHYTNEATDTRVIADEQAFVQVMDNLLSNAVKYSPHGKQIFVRVVSVEAAVRIEVQDEGEGISEEDIKKLFGKFVRLSAQTTGGEHSTGLGLSIVKKMVAAMHGRVWCESEAGKGATFIVELPKA
jgi:signal transduction histidine kinase